MKEATIHPLTADKIRQGTDRNPAIVPSVTSPYADNLEHLEALEQEALLLLAMADARTRAVGGKDAPAHKHGALDSIGSSEFGIQHQSPILPGEPLQELMDRLAHLQKGIRKRESASVERGGDLQFFRLCASSGLDEFERKILLYLFCLNTSSSFKNSMKESAFARFVDEEGVITIEGLLSLSCSGYREQIARRKHFSVQGALRRERIIVVPKHGDETTSVTMRKVHLHERIVRFILGDNNLYNLAFKGITREQGTVPLSQVVLPEGLKEEIVQHLEAHIRSQKTREDERIDVFYGYGTGFALLLNGPSGTGKTVLAHALSAHLGKPLFQVNVGEGQELHELDDVIRYVFREARLYGGIVFFDECDDSFMEGSYLSRILLVELEKSQGITILATNRISRLDPSLERRISLRVEVPFPEEAQRREIWRNLIPATVGLDDDVDFGILARRYELSGGLIKNAIFLAVNEAIARGKRLRLTMEDLDHAARIQSVRVFEENTLGESYVPKQKIDALPIHHSDRETLTGLANAWPRIREQALGLNLFITCGDLTTGMRAAEALAQACGMSMRRFSMSELINTTAKFRNPLTQITVEPLEYAFAQGVGQNALKVFVADWEPQTENNGDRNDKMKMGPIMPRFLVQLRQARGFHVLLTRNLRGPLPPEFHFRVDIRFPSETVQLKKWGRWLGTEAEREDRLVDLVERHPMHIEEIDFIMRQAAVRALVSGKTGNISIEDVEGVFATHRATWSTQILFGNIREIDEDTNPQVPSNRGLRK